MKKSTHKRLVAWLLTLALVVTLLPGMGMTALAVEDGGEGNGPPAAEVVEPEDESSGSDETVGTPPSTESEPPALPESKEEDKTTEGEGGSSGSDYDIGDDTQPRGRTKAPTALAAGYENVKVNSVTLRNGQYLESNSATTAINSSTVPSSYVAWYKDGVLTLNGYSGNYIQVSGASKSDLTVKLKGSSNTITSSYRGGILQNGKGGSITVTADSSSDKLTIDVTYSPSVAGIDNGTVANDILGDVTITGYADVMIKARTTGDSSSQGYGIYAKNAFILDNASVNITCETQNRTSGDLCNGIYASEAATINTAGKIKIDVTEAGTGDAHSYGINVVNRSLTLTKAAEMVVEWRNGPDASTAGAPYIPKTASFAPGTHAVNVDTTNCFASYRSGEQPYEVTVNNGTLTGPGVKYPNGSGKFLAGDKVDLTAPDRQISTTDNTPIPFDKWTSANVSITNSTSQNEAYITVPSNDATVTAHYKVFTVQPSFTRIDSTKGTVSFTLISTGPQDGPYLCPANNLGSGTGGFMPVDGTTIYEKEVYENYTLPGEYMVKVKYNKVIYYSEPFMIDYSARAASVSPVTISGETGQSIESTNVTVTLQDCTFNTSLGGTGSWITNLPAGLTQSVTRVSDTEAKITVSGTPMVNCVEQIKVTVPKAALSGGTSALTAPSYENAKFDIKTTLTTAAATIQPPVAGQHPDMNPVSADPSKYTVDFEEWSGPNGRMGPTNTFEADKWYTCYLTFTPKSGYAFASGSDMTYTINGDDAQLFSSWVRLAMKALPSAISLDVSGTVDLGNKKLYDTVPVKNIEVTNHLSSAISNIPITLSDPTNFRVLPQSIKSIPANGTGTFQVAPAPNLPLGEYSTTVTVGGGSSGIIEQSFTVEFSVREVIMLIANPLTYNGERQTGVTASEADVIIEGNRQRDAGNYTATAYLKSGYYMWPDYTTNSSKQIQWSIGKRTPQPTDIVVTPPTNAVYDGNRKDATAKLDSKYTGAGAITISKYVDDTGNAADPINAGTYTVYVNVAGGSNFNSATDLTNNLSPDWTFTIYKTGQDAPVGLGASAPTVSDGKGKINSTTANMQYTKTPDVPISWSDCTEGSTMVNPGTYYVRYKGDNNHDASPNVKVIVPEYGAGVTVSGTAVSWNGTDNAEYRLYDGSTSDADIKADWKAGSYTGTACTSKGTPTASGKQFEQTFTFDTVAAGNYKLVIVKPGHGLWIEELTVNTDNIADKSIRLYKMGDVNKDGKVNGTDALWVRQSGAGSRTLDAYQKVLADLNRDGKVNGTDVLWIRQIGAGSRTLTY